MEALSHYTGAPTEHLEDNKSCICVVEDKIGIPTVKHIDVPVYFLQNNFDNGLFIPKYYKSSVMLADMCTKPCSGTIISGSNKWMTGFILYPISDTNTINS